MSYEKDKPAHDTNHDGGTTLDQNDYGITQARVTAVHRERYALACEHGDLYGRLKKSAYRTGEAIPTVGDFVLIDYNPSGDSQILRTLPRRTFFSRRAAGPDGTEQAVAANCDYVFVMQSMNQNFNLSRLERYLTLAWQSGAKPVVVLTKLDLADTPERYLEDARSVSQGAPVHAVSALTGEGLEELSPYLAPGKTTAFLGSSGVGKSSLVNALAGEDVMAVRAIRESDARGRHTTVHRQLLRLPGGAFLIDTPGMRELGMWEAAGGLTEAFPEVEALLGRCRFSDCQHRTEPGCAIQAALQDGTLSPQRWENYQKLQAESAYAERKAAALRRKQQRGKSSR